MQVFEIVTLGCKVNQCESQLLREQLESLGLRESMPGEAADICVVNTCAVTATAQGKSVRAMRRLKKENPQARVVAVGCGVSASPEAYAQADLSLRQDEKRLAARKILGTDSGIKATSGFRGHARAFLKIQDGCDSYCSYCIVPYLRGRPRSKPVEAIEREARAIARNGYGELVLAGTHLGLYGRDFGGRVDLAYVVERLLETGLFPRLRLSGVEANEVSDRLIELIADDNALCPHLHVPLQSGSARVLRDMGRSYTPDGFLGVLAKVRDAGPRAAVTTDVIAGFPTEEAQDFGETLDVCRRAGFSRMHIFPYSRRSGTEAAERWKAGACADAPGRSKALRELGAELAQDYARRFHGEAVRVLAESHADGRPAKGYTDHYLRAEVHGAQVAQGMLVEGVAVSSEGGVLSVNAVGCACGGDR